MRLLLDTHALIWWLADDPSLPLPVRARIAEPADEVLASAASAMETVTKRRLGKLPETAALAQDFEAIVTDQGFSPLPISLRHRPRSCVTDPEPGQDARNFGRRNNPLPPPR